jgi:tRNA-dihydrouridine synthase B
MPNIGNITLPDFPLLLAPMEDVSNPPFRALCRNLGADIVISEFISSEGLIKNAMSARKKLDIFDNERPVGIQIFGGDEQSLAMASAIVETTNPDFLDINFGCPVKAVAGAGAGAAVLKDVDRMVRLTKACVEATRLPVTVKTRLGWDENSLNIEEVAERLQDVGIAALSIHGRTRAQMYKGEADWTLIGKVRNNQRIHIPIFGNGDINSASKAIEYRNRYGVDGIMIGRAAITHPWIFREIKYLAAHGTTHHPPTPRERIKVCQEHLERSINWKGKEWAVFYMRGKYGGYLKPLPGIRPFLQQLMTLTSPRHIHEVLNEIGDHFEKIDVSETTIELVNYHERCPL